MATDAALIAALDLGSFDDSFRSAGLDRWSDERLAAAVGAVLAEPKEAEANSFVLHAPLELLARVGLLPLVAEERRHEARLRLASLGTMFAHAGPALPTAVARTGFAEGFNDLDEAVRFLIRALEAGDLDDVDRGARALAALATPQQVAVGIADAVTASLAAAAHAAILLCLWPRLSPGGELPAGIIRQPLRELARHPDWRLRWFEHPDLSGEPGTADLAAALAETPRLGVPGSTFIQPLMNQAEASGVAPRLLTGMAGGRPDPKAVRRAVTRVATQSMLQETGERPYGWSHCLTLPQAVTGLAKLGVAPTTVAAVAGTHVVGFRAAFGTAPLDLDRTPPPVDGVERSTPIREAILHSPDAAAHVAWCAAADPASRGPLVTELATRASLHHDAHLVKYTLACLDAATEAPDDAPTVLAAAACLSGWWATEPEDGLVSYG